jgi:predicted TPR repeat methyltransferase
VDRLYDARDLDELRREYDRIAAAYDDELVDGLGWVTPGLVAETVSRLVPTEAKVLDAGAGTGLLGIALADAGFEDVDALDISPGMLAQAALKGVYGDLREGRLGEPLDWRDGTYDAVVAAGVLTVGHAPASCLDELVRITRRGGHVIFTLRSDEVPPGFDEKIDELEAAARWQLVDRSEEYQALPHGHPEVLLRVWSFRVR